MNVILAVPSRYTMQNETVGTLIDLALALARKGAQVGYHFTSSPYIDQNRHLNFQYALRHGADYLFFVDNDIYLLSNPDEAVHALFSLDKDIAVGIYHLRIKPHYPLIFDIIEPGKPCFEFRDIPAVPTRVDAAATGFMLIKRKVMEAFTDEYMCENGMPFAQMQLEQEGKVSMLGEDLSFCWRAHVLGFEIWADPSIHLSHIDRQFIHRATWEGAKGVYPVKLSGGIHDRGR